MENLTDLELKNIINDITQGRELANQLQIHLHSPSSSQETRQFLVNKIIDSYDKVLGMVKPYHTRIEGKELFIPSSGGGTAIGTSGSPPRSFSESPRSQHSDTELKDNQYDCNDVSKKRKAGMPRWTKQVQVNPSMGPEGPLDDGYNWRKYGQKEILGAKYPRGYYRCTYRHSQGCLATKQVQRSDDDPSILEITYKGRHTCNETTKQESNASRDQNNHGEPQIQQPCHQNQCGMGRYKQTPLSDFHSNMKVITENLNTKNQSTPHSFNFPSSSSDISHENFEFLVPNCLIDNNFSTDFPSSIMPPISTNSNYFLTSPSQINNNFQEHINFETSEHVITDMGSEITSTTSFTMGPIITMAFGPNFTFDNQGFSSS